MIRSYAYSELWIEMAKGFSDRLLENQICAYKSLVRTEKDQKKLAKLIARLEVLVKEADNRSQKVQRR